MDYAIIDDVMRIPTQLPYEFKKDKTCSFLNDSTGEKTEGKWDFNPQKKTINLFFRKDAQNDIVSLSENDLVIQPQYVEKETGRKEYNQ